MRSNQFDDISQPVENGKLMAIALNYHPERAEAQNSSRLAWYIARFY